MLESITEKLERLKAAAQKLESSEATPQEFEQTAQFLAKELKQSPYLDYVNAIVLINDDKIDKAEAVLLKSLEKFRFFHITYLMLMQIYQAKGDTQKVFDCYVNTAKFADTEEEKKQALEFLKNYMAYLMEIKDEFFAENSKKLIERIKEANQPTTYMDFPIDKNEHSLVRTKDLFKDRTDDTYFLNLYKANGYANVNKTISYFVKTEMLRGSFVKGEVTFNKSKGELIAISATGNENIDMDISFEDKVVNKKNLIHNRFHFFNIPKNGGVKLNAEKEYFLSQPKINSTDGKPKLVLNIFIDSLSFDFVKKEGFEKLMPNTHKFFKKGLVATDCHATGEWTHPSVMSISTGKYTTGHNNFHAAGDYEPELYSKLLQEHFASAGYYVARICNNWRLTPNMGYYKKVDRFVYCPMTTRMYAEEMVMEAVEHLESFKHYNNYLWLTIEDLHEAAEGTETGLLSSLWQKEFLDSGEKSEGVSVYQKYGDEKVNLYRAKLKRADFYLALLYDYLEKSYENDEMIVCLFSDHGMSFLSQDETMFTEERSDVPLMLRGRGVPPHISDELISTIDIYPTLLKLCGIETENEQIDGRLMADFGGEKREFAYTEAIYPKQTYRAAIRDAAHVFHFETAGATSMAGLVDLSAYTARILDRRTNEDVTEREKEKVEYYLSVVYEHIKSWLKFW